jgi:methylase of polypeptide subunit release factors
VEIIASDLYREALEVAAMNRERLGLTQHVGLVRSDLLAGLHGPFDIVLANLPYLRDDQRHPSIEAEPSTSLYAGPDGFAYYRAILSQLPGRLVDGGLFVGEIDPAQAEMALAEGRAALDVPVLVEHDDAGDERYLLIGTL